MTIRILRALLGSSAVALLAGCGGDSAVTPDARTPQVAAAAASAERALAIELTTPNAGDAGIIFSIEGPNVVGVTPTPGVNLVMLPPESNGRGTIDVLAVGHLQSGVIAWLTTKGVNNGNPFMARVIEVAAGSAEGFVERGELSAYRLVVRR